MKRSLVLARSIRLPKLPIAMPTEGKFAVDAAGAAKPPTPESLAKDREQLLAKSAPITKDAFWKMPIHDGFAYIAKTCSYFQVADIAMQHSFFSLFDDMLSCHDAPLPHVIYTDLLKCKTFASLQSPPDEQFSLSSGTLRSLLQMASFNLLHDPHYFASVEKLFRTIELQQTVGSEVLSAWVQCCVFAGRTAMAVQTLDRMERHRVPFDSEVFCSMMSPTSVGPTPDKSKGDAAVRLAHQRLFTNMSANCSPSAVGLHAAFVANSLLMRHANKWEVLRMALTYPSGRVDVAHRTLELASAVLDLETGARCGPKTNEALAVAFARQGTADSMDSLFKVLYYMRSVEALPQFTKEPMAVFSDEAAEVISVAVKKAMSEQPSKALKCQSALYLMRHTATEFREGTRPDGPLARSLTSKSERLQFGELLEAMGYRREENDKRALSSLGLEGNVNEGLGENTAALTSNSGLSSSTSLDEISSEGNKKVLGYGDEEEVSSSLFPSLSSTRTGGLSYARTGSRAADIERAEKAKEAWARSRLATAWMNPTTPLPDAPLRSRNRPMKCEG